MYGELGWACDVFVVVDVGWKDSLNYAQKILDVGFSSGSTVVVWNQTMQVVSNLLRDESCTKPFARSQWWWSLPNICEVFFNCNFKLKDADERNVTKWQVVTVWRWVSSSCIKCSRCKVCTELEDTNGWKIRTPSKSQALIYIQGYKLTESLVQVM